MRVFVSSNSALFDAYCEGEEVYKEWHTRLQGRLSALGFAAGEVVPVFARRGVERVLLGFSATFTDLTQHGFQPVPDWNDVHTPVPHSLADGLLGSLGPIPEDSLVLVERFGMPASAKIGPRRMTSPEVSVEGDRVVVCWHHDVEISFDEAVWSER